MNVMSNIKQRIKEIIISSLKLTISKDDLIESKLISTYNINSLNMMEILVSIELEFGIELEASEISLLLFESIDNIEQFILSHADKEQIIL